MSVAWGLIIGIKNVLELPGEEGEGVFVFGFYSCIQFMSFYIYVRDGHRVTEGFSCSTS